MRWVQTRLGLLELASQLAVTMPNRNGEVTEGGVVLGIWMDRVSAGLPEEKRNTNR